MLYTRYFSLALLSPKACVRRLSLRSLPLPTAFLPFLLPSPPPASLRFIALFIITVLPSFKAIYTQSEES